MNGSYERSFDRSALWMSSGELIIYALLLIIGNVPIGTGYLALPGSQQTAFDFAKP